MLMSLKIDAIRDSHTSHGSHQSHPASASGRSRVSAATSSASSSKGVTTAWRAAAFSSEERAPGLIEPEVSVQRVLPWLGSAEAPGRASAKGGWVAWQQAERAWACSTVSPPELPVSGLALASSADSPAWALESPPPAHESQSSPPEAPVGAGSASPPPWAPNRRRPSPLQVQERWRPHPTKRGSATRAGSAGGSRRLRGR